MSGMTEVLIVDRLSWLGVACSQQYKTVVLERTAGLRVCGLVDALTIHYGYRIVCARRRADDRPAR